MLKSLSYIPLPLRIIALLILGVLATRFLGAIRPVLVPIVIVLWILVISTVSYELGWLNVAARIPGLRQLLRHLSARAPIPGPAAPGVDGDSDAAPAENTPRGALTADDRAALIQQGRAALDRLIGVEGAREAIEQRLLAPAQNSSDNPFATASPALVVTFEGGRGTGKSTAALAAVKLLAGASALESGHVVLLEDVDLRSNRSRSASELGRMKAKEAIGGALLLENADWLMEQDPYGGQSLGLDVGLAILEVARSHPRSFVILMTMSEEAGQRLPRDEGHTRWLGKLTLRRIQFGDLDDESLVTILASRLGEAGWSLDPGAERSGERLMAEVRERAGDAFDNADACRRTAESLIEIGRELGVENTTITRQVIIALDERLE